jgi:hypothetical protein
MLHRFRPAPPQGHRDAVQGPPPWRPAAGTVFRPDGHHRSPFPHPDSHLQGILGRRKALRQLAVAYLGIGHPARIGASADRGARQPRLEPEPDQAVVPRRHVQQRPAPAINGNFILNKLHWSAWARTSAHATGRIGWAQPGQGGGSINRQAPVRVRVYAVAVHHGRRYFSRLAFSITWHHHAYAGKVRFADPCGNTAGCWIAPGMPVA